MEPGRPVIRAEEAEAGAQGSGRLAEAYARHAGAAVGLAYLLTGDRHLAEDLVQEAFVRLAGRFGHLRNPDAFEAYLRRTVVNLFTSHLRRRRLERAYLEREGGRPAASVEPVDVGSRDEVWSALQKLPERQRAAVVLRFYEDLSEQQVAETMRCSVPAAKSLVARAMETLRNEITERER